ncbi:N-acetylglucosamine-6-phosphate deacetylase [Parapedobacter tibetensis]|uniref:N-acetylglucosamine-6-phosphate deacetylase n=1 Tax=Parapedobacter tibetensis TaxID=2972951 RepID=UPI00214D48C7|nr:N-acetylglucosamine-6-phosphate deacetylase [Parapedobacter tibetensis]
MIETPIVITNGIVYTGTETVNDKAVLIEGNIIKGLIRPEEIPTTATILDAHGNFVSPGLIDLQIYGAGGYLFSAKPSKAAIDGIVNTLLASGTTSFMLTLATNSLALFGEALDISKANPHPALLGLHFEGPYLNPKKRGAHPTAYIRAPDRSEIKTLLDRSNGCLRMMTIAPELFGEDNIRLLLDNGILLSAGHSDATMKQAMQGFDYGIQAATHLFNAMSPFHHREPGLPGAVFQHNGACASIIADGIHVDYQTLAISKKIVKERLFLITDAVTDTEEGLYTHVFKGDRYTLPDGTLSGSALTLLQAVANCVRHVDIPLDEALRMATLYPARLIGAKDLGRIAPGYKANIIVFDTSYTIKQVVFEGETQPILR